MESIQYEPSPLTRELLSRGLTLSTFAAMAERADYTQCQAYNDLVCLDAGGPIEYYPRLELILALAKIDIDIFGLRMDLKTWRKSLPYSRAQSQVKAPVR